MIDREGRSVTAAAAGCQTRGVAISPPASALSRLVRLDDGEPASVARRVLLLGCELLGMDIGYLTVVDLAAQTPSRRVVMAVDRHGSDVPGAEGWEEPLDVSWCGRVVADGALLVRDVSGEPDLAGLPSTARFGIVSHAGVVVSSPATGEPVGTLCVVGRGPHESLNARDEAVLRDLAAVLAPLLPGLAAAQGRPYPAQLTDLPEQAVAATTLEGLTRPLLQALHELTRLGSTYLTQIHRDTDEQELRYVLNARPDFALPEGLTVPWPDTLCRRALDEGRVCTTDVPGVWGDSQAAAELGIQVYVSVPVELDDGQVWGTLCAADSRPAAEVDAQLPTLRLFSRLIAAEVQRASLVDHSQVAAARAQELADTDALTGCAQRRLVEPWLQQALATAPAEHEVVVAFLDLNDFKRINDTLGHAAGDTVLVETARRVRRGLRSQDLLARYGGDEFLVAAVLPAEAMPEFARRLHDLEAFTLHVDGLDLAVGLSVGVSSEPGPGSDAPAVDGAELIARADRAMYQVKRRRRR